VSVRPDTLSKKTPHARPTLPLSCVPFCTMPHPLRSATGGIPCGASIPLRAPLRSAPSPATQCWASSSVAPRPGNQERGPLQAGPRSGAGVAGRCQAAPPSVTVGWPEPDISPLCVASYARRVKNACCKPMFQVFHMYQRYVAIVSYGCCKSRSRCTYVAMVVQLCCKLLFLMFHLFFCRYMLQVCLFECCNVSYICCNCFIRMLRMFYHGFHEFFLQAF
jgi:hypothetical protein